MHTVPIWLSATDKINLYNTFGIFICKNVQYPGYIPK